MDDSIDLDHRRTPPATVELPVEKDGGEATSSSSSGEVSVELIKDVDVASPPSNDASNCSGGGEAVFTRVNTTPAKILNSGEMESPSVLERSKTEGLRRNNILPEEAAQIYDNRISVQQKVQTFGVSASEILKQILKSQQMLTPKLLELILKVCTMKWMKKVLMKQKFSMFPHCKL